MWQLQGIDLEEFISRYWQKQPCVIRQAFVGFESPVSPEELAGLACEEDVHCRLIVERGEAGPWEVRYGPFADADFLALPESHYSLLVSECEKWMPELNDLLDQFRFVPDWRIDDLMLSYAPGGGSVGPHVDEYDVFLLQAMGGRRWQYAESRVENPQLVPNLELAILQDFAYDQEIVLQPGDMLYLPPGFAHHGTALEPCLTYSIGFRAPTAASMLESFALESTNACAHNERYRDPDLELDRHPAEITAKEIERLRELATELMQQAQEQWPDAVGKMLSDSAVIPDSSDPQPVFVSDLLATAWIRHPETRLLYHRTDRGIRVYYNGRVHVLPDSAPILESLRQLCDRHEWSQDLIRRCLAIDSLEALLLELATNGAIIPEEI